MNIRGKKIWLTALMALIIGVLMVFAYKYHVNAPLKGMKIHLNDEEVYSFLQKEDIERLFIHEKNIHIEQLSINTADLEALEAIVLAHPWVAEANLYIDNGRYLNIDVEQRIPIARIFDQKDASYYLDKEGNVMPVTVGYSYPTIVFTNVINSRDTVLMNGVQGQIIYLSNYLHQDSFWSKQIVQVNMVQNDKFELSTLLGNQKIILGDTSALSLKLSNLMAFYQQVSNPLGWDKYSEINISFLNQVIASPSLGWVPPKPVDTLIRMPDELKDGDLIQTLPERPMEEAKGIIKDEVSNPQVVKPIVTPKPVTDSVKQTKDSTKIAQ